MNRTLKTILFILISVILVMAVFSFLAAIAPVVIAVLLAIFIYNSYKSWKFKKKGGQTEGTYKEEYTRRTYTNTTEDLGVDLDDNNEVIDVQYEDVDK